MLRTTVSKPIFILGAPRSGTTFLASLLEKTEYGPPFETQFITKYYKILHTYGDLGIFKNFEGLLTDVLSERAVSQWDLKLDVKVFFNELKGDTSYSNIVDKLCLSASRKFGFSAWGDKTPHYLGDLDILYTLFPDSKFIYIVRDGRDVSLSLFEKNWGPNNIYYSALYWVYLNRNHKEAEILKNKKQLFFVRYEDLLVDIDSYVDKIYHFLNMDYSKAEVKILTQKVRKGNFNKWKKSMSAEQIKVFENIAAESLNEFGYETSHKVKPIFFLKKWVYQLHHFALRAKHLFVINVIDTFKIKYFGKAPFAE